MYKRQPLKKPTEGFKRSRTKTERIDTVSYTHLGAVERVASVALVLARLVEHRHHQRDAVGGAADGGDGALDVLKVLVRALSLIHI